MTSKLNLKVFSTCLHVGPVTFFCFDFGLPYLAHGSITMRGGVRYIHDSNRTLNFDLKEFKEVLTCFCVLPITFVCFDTSIPYLAHGSNTKREYVAFIHDPDMMLTFDLKVKFIVLCFGHSFYVYWHSPAISGTCFGYSFYVYWHSPTISGTWVYHHRIKCHKHLWPLYDFDLGPQYRYYIFNMNCMGKIIFALWTRHTKYNWHMGVSQWDNILCTFMTCVWPYPLTYMWWREVSFESFTHCFYLFIYMIIIYIFCL